MVLRYAFDRGSPARAAAGEHVTPDKLALFLRRFGPMRSCLLKAARCVRLCCALRSCLSASTASTPAVSCGELCTVCRPYEKAMHPLKQP